MRVNGGNGVKCPFILTISCLFEFLGGTLLESLPLREGENRGLGHA